MAWIHGEMSVAEAISELVRCAAAIIQDASVDGQVHIEIENDGSFTVRKPDTANTPPSGKEQSCFSA